MLLQILTASLHDEGDVLACHIGKQMRANAATTRIEEGRTACDVGDRSLLELMHWLNRVDVRRMAKPESTVTLQPPCKHFPTGSKRGRHGMIKGLSPIVLEHKLSITFCRVPLSEMRRNRPP